MYSNGNPGIGNDGAMGIGHRACDHDQPARDRRDVFAHCVVAMTSG